MAKKKSAAERRAQSKRAAERVAAAEPASAMSAAEADAQAQLLAQYRPPQPSISLPTVSSPAPAGPRSGAFPPGAVPVLTAEQRAHPDLVLIRELAEQRRLSVQRSSTPPLPSCDDDIPGPRWLLPRPRSRRRVSFSTSYRIQPFHAGDPPATIRPTAYPVSSAPLSKPPSAAAPLAPCPARSPPPRPSPGVPQQSSALLPPRDLLSLVAGSFRRPWRGLRQRRQRLQQQRAPHPHRHQRQLQHDARMHAERVRLEYEAVQQSQECELRQALFAALGPMFPSPGASRAAGWATPEAPIRPDSPQLEVEVSLCVFQGEKRAGYHDPRAVASAHDIDRIRSGFRGWHPHELSALKATHSFIVWDRDKWQRGIDEFAINYLTGLHDRFCPSGLQDWQS